MYSKNNSFYGGVVLHVWNGGADVFEIDKARSFGGLFEEVILFHAFRRNNKHRFRYHLLWDSSYFR